MNKKDHVALDELVLHMSYDDVHTWLDEMYPKYNGFEHWRERHHLNAIFAKFGPNNTPEYCSAVLHILSDWISHIREAILPKDEEDVMHYLREFHLVE